jgi:hypothetical protein
VHSYVATKDLVDLITEGVSAGKGMQRERLEHRTLIALKANVRNLLRSAMHPSVGSPCHPGQRLCVEVRVVEKLAKKLSRT